MPEPTSSSPSPLTPKPGIGSSLGDSADNSSTRTAVGIAVAVIVLVVAALVFFGSRHQAPDPNLPRAAAPYAAQLPLSGLAMSESTSISGGKSTFIDGTVTNNGPSTVTAATVQVFFRTDDPAAAPHLETVPLALIRTREPYIDTQPIAAAPLAPGDHRDFRLIFESLPDGWNQQLPEIRVVSVTTR